MVKEAHGSHNPNHMVTALLVGTMATVDIVGSHITLVSRHTIPKEKVMANHNSGTILAKARK
eukprot:6209142-Amphidinium_carterae.1